LNAGRPAISQIRESFRTVDFVVALLYSNKSTENVVFEIGVALGAGRPLLIFAESDVHLPSDLLGLSVVRLALSDLTKVIPYIQRYLEPKVKPDVTSLSMLAPTAEHRIKPRLRGAELRNEIQRVRNIAAHTPNLTAFESELSSLLSRIGWTVAEARPSAKSYAPDLAVWIDEIQKEIGNPIAIEVKTRLRPGDLDRAVAQLSRYLETTSAKAGLVLYEGPQQNLQRNIAQISPIIFAFSFGELADLLEESKFPAALKSSFSAAKRIS
jgi:hypothetical protein